MQGLKLLLVLVFTTSLVMSSSGFGNRRLCGIQLVEALLLVCGKKGLFYQPGRRLRDHETRGPLKHRDPQEISQNTVSAGPRLMKRGIVEQCCHFFCDYYDLENYCNT